MEHIHARYSVSITELKSNPSALLEKVEGAPIAILNHNKPTAYLIPAHTYELLMEQIDDHSLWKIIKEREGEKSIKVSLDDL